MRLNASNLGLFAGLLVQGVVGQTATSAPSTEPTTTVSPGAYITFEDNLNSSKVFKQTDGDVPVTFQAVLESRLTVQEVRLHRQEKDGSDDSVIGVGEANSLAGMGRRGVFRIHSNAGLSARQPDSPLLPPESGSPDDGGSIVLKVDAISMNEYNTSLAIQSDAVKFATVWNDKILYMEVVSTNETNVAHSYSPAFIVVNANDQAVITEAEGTLSTQVRHDDTLGANSEESIAPTSTPEPTSTPDASTDEDESGGSGGLAPGAIAGIAVGVAVAALAIAAFLGWFFCLRRRQQQRRRRSGAEFARAHEGPYGAGSGAVMMTEKEAAVGGVASAAESRDRGFPGSASGAAAADESAAYGTATPYNDHNDYEAPPGMAVTTTGADSQASLPLNQPHYYGGHSRDQSRSTATPGAGSSPIEARYAHLVEEGMTEDEIRRLEEEERQLDAAIEEAGSGGGGNGNGNGQSNNSDSNNNNSNNRQQNMSPTSPTSLTMTTPPTSPTATRGH